MTNDPMFPNMQKVGEMLVIEGGLTKREYFAAAALQGIMANEYTCGHVGIAEIPKFAVEMADRLIEELAKS